MVVHEDSRLLGGGQRRTEQQQQPSSLFRRSFSSFEIACFICGALGLLSFLSSWDQSSSTVDMGSSTTTKEESLVRSEDNIPIALSLQDVPLEGKHHKHRRHNKKHRNDTKRNQTKLAEPTERCHWVIKTFVNKYFWVSNDELKQQYAMSTQDPNTFYRATANIFWVDYVKNGWGMFCIVGRCSDVRGAA